MGTNTQNYRIFNLISGSPVLVNTEHFMYASAATRGTWLYFANGSSLQVSEDISAVLTKLVQPIVDIGQVTENLASFNGRRAG